MGCCPGTKKASQFEPLTRRFDTFTFARSRSIPGDMAPTIKKTSIADLRGEIDVVDEKLIRLLAERQRLVEAVVSVKHRDGIPARIPERVDYVIDRARVLARAHHLDPALAESIWTEMVEWFVAHEERTLDMKK
jgi:isochorismate pyruvate lyase